MRKHPPVMARPCLRGTDMHDRSSSPYWRVSPRFWADTADWSEDARLLALYLLTCEHRTTEGLFVLRLPYIHADLNWPPERLTQPLAELIGHGFIEHDLKRSVFLIVKALKYQAPANPNSRKAAVRKLALVPSDSPLTCTFKRLCQQLCEPLWEQLPEGFGEPPSPAPSSNSPSYSDLSGFEPSSSAIEAKDSTKLYTGPSAIRAALHPSTGRAS